MFLLIVSLQTIIESDSDSSVGSEPEIANYNTSLNKIKKQTPSVAELLRNSLLQQNMTSFESMTAQLATIASLNGLSPLYPGDYTIDHKSDTKYTPINGREMLQTLRSP